MKLFGRTGGYWLFWVSAIYLTIGFINLWVYRFAEPEHIQLGYVIVLAFPLFNKRLATWLNMKPLWQ